MKRLCCLLCGLFFCGVCFAEEGFTINTIVYGMDGLPSAAVDVNNNPIISFTSVPYPEYGTLYTAARTDAGYQIEQVGDFLEASWPTIAVNSNNELAVVFQTADDNLWYGTKGSWFDWIFSLVAGNAPQACADMALTSNDIPHLAYVGSLGGYVQHSFFDVHSQQWSTESLVGFGNSSIGCLDIDIDGSGRILIGCKDGGGITRCAVYSDGFWNYLPTIEQTSFSDSGFTADGLPAVAYTRQEILYYAVYIDIIGWVETQVVPVQATGGHRRISLAHSLTGVPGIAYVENDKLIYATNIAGGWTTTHIDYDSQYLDLIFDHNDKPLIAYAGWDNCLDVPVIKLAGIGLEPLNIADLNKDGIVNFYDFAILADYWMTILPEPDLTIGDFDQNAEINALDLRWISCNWLWQDEE